MILKWWFWVHYWEAVN